VQQINAALKALSALWITLKRLVRPPTGEHKIHFYRDHDGWTATCTCTNEAGEPWYTWNETQLEVARDVHLHLLPLYFDSGQERMYQ
jgi:hypothetical protein